MKQLLYDLRVIDLPQTQWHPQRPWLVGIALGLLAFALAFPADLLALLLATTISREEALFKLKDIWIK